MASTVSAVCQNSNQIHNSSTVSCTYMDSLFVHSWNSVHSEPMMGISCRSINILVSVPNHFTDFYDICYKRSTLKVVECSEFLCILVLSNSYFKEDQTEFIKNGSSHETTGIRYNIPII